ncbi:MAG TPA: flagellar hook-length control protein FliK [Sphingomonas sp.]|uniref:flagellar hook-length control protein FliK n=1 Tax=Sphingomonas sp. TaxID=28214 RepID=UPI002BC3C32A|nr:flagellar hook-length control protein FliK [Sphingomonas sp.]HMI17997.1 flagellar hook-length control protein FliK [Sphingomonas sp.]
MPDAALSISASPLAALLTGAPADSHPTSATAQLSDPFAALLASATGIKAGTAAPTTTTTTDAVAALLASAAKVATPPVAASPIAVVTLPTTVEALSTEAEAALPVAEDAGTDDKDADSKDQSDDPLADAIASGATAVLALAPVIVAPIQPQSTASTQTPSPTPIQIDAPIGMTMPKRLPIAGMPGGGPFKPAAQLAAHTDARIADAAQTSADSASAQAAANAARLADTAQTNADSNSAQADTHTPQPPTTDPKPAATALSPEMAKAVIATLRQDDGTATAADPTIVAVATPVAPMPNAQAQAEAQKPQSPVSQQVQAEQTAQVQAPVRRRGDEVAAPRRTGDTRKRVETAVADIAAAGSSQRAEPTLTFGRAAATVQPKGDAVVEQTLTVARDGAWLDTLARDIANSAGNGSDLQFKLDPQNLGSLTVAISQSEDGASIRMTADNDTTRNLLLDAQPKLIAEARAQGLKVSDTHVDLKQDQSQNHGQNQSSGQDASRWAQGNAGQDGTAQNGQNRQSSPDHQPFVSNLGRKAEAESESLEGDSDALYA